MVFEWKLAVWLVTIISCGTAQAVPTVRLVDRNGPNPFEGRVEVFYEGSNDTNQHVSGWFTVCDDYWDVLDAEVVCRQLGFRGAAGAYHSSYFGAGSTPIGMDQVHCSARETRLQDCEFDGWFNHDCSHTEDAGVRCRVHDPASWHTIPVRLAMADVEGIVEIQYRGVWGAVDKLHFGDESARVVCGQLGYPDGAVDSCTTEERGVYNGSIMARGFLCNGGETTLSMCKLMYWGPFNKDGGEYNTSDLAYIRCSRPPTNNNVTPTKATIADNGINILTTKHVGVSSEGVGIDTVLQLRFRGGVGPWEGRVEIFNAGDWNHGEWSPLCDRDWNQFSANAVCRQLGYGTARTIYRGSHFGRGIGYAYNRVFKCHGNESMLSQCRDKDVGWQGCKHWQEAGVECYKPGKVSERVRFVDSGLAGFVEIRDDTCNKWYHVCDEGWGLPHARVICRELELGFGSMGRLKPDSNKNGIDFINVKYHCTGDELQLSDCRKDALSAEELVCNGGVKLRGKDLRDVQKKRLGNCSTISHKKSDCCDSGFAWVQCVSLLPDLIPDVRELRHSMAAYPHIVTVGGLPCALEEGCFGKSATSHGGSHDHDRVLVRFTTRVMNLGRAPFVPHQPHENWKWHSCHKHYHSFEAFTIYHVIDKRGRQAAEGHKASFCLEDSDCEERGPTRLTNYNCRGPHGGRQGISVNCADSYQSGLDCQWVDVTDIPNGRYRLVVDVNPHHRVAETDFSNNVAYCDFGYHGPRSQIRVEGCGIDPTWKSPRANDYIY